MLFTLIQILQVEICAHDEQECFECCSLYRLNAIGKVKYVKYVGRNPNIVHIYNI